MTGCVIHRFFYYCCFDRYFSGYGLSAFTQQIQCKRYSQIVEPAENSPEHFICIFTWNKNRRKLVNKLPLRNNRVIEQSHRFEKLLLNNSI